MSWIFSGWPIPSGIKEARAAITYQSPGALNYSAASGTSVAPPYPASIAAGDLLILMIGMKPSSANSGSVTEPADWDPIPNGSLTGAGGYGTTLGADTGNTNVFTYYKIATGSETGSLTVTIATNSVSWAQMYRFSSDATVIWSVAGTTGSDITAGSVSIGMSADPGVAAGDYVIGAMVIPTDVTTPSQFSAEGLSQTGITFGAVTEISEPDSSNGNDIGGFTYRAPVSSGTSSAAPTLTATAGGTTTNVRGPGVFIRVRETPLPQAPTLYSDDGGSNQIAYNNARQNDTTPIVRASAAHTASFNRFQVEFNTASDFSGTAYTETFSGTYSSGTQYNLQTTGTLGLPGTDGAVYYVRARASANGGTNYGDWSSGTWSYAYKSSGDPDWFQTTDAQFATGTLSSTGISGSGSVQLAGGAIAKAGTDTSLTNAGGAVSTVNFSHTLVSGSNRMVAVSAGYENNGNLDINGITYGGTAMTKAADATTGTSGYIQTSEIWYILETSLAAMGDGSKTVEITFSTTGSSDMEVDAFAAEYTGVSQGAPEATDSDFQASGATITSTISPTSGAWVISAMGGGNTGNTWTHGQSQVEVFDYNDNSSTVAVAELRGANGETSLASTEAGTVNRLSRAAASWPGASASSGTIMSPEIDFDWVAGQASWGAVSFSTNETNGDVKLKVYYTVTTACDTAVPNSALSGNSSGFDVSAGPISLYGLTPVASTYNKICLQATLTNSGGTPFLNDWTVGWSASSFSTAIEVRAQNYTTSIVSITFPQVAPGAVSSQPYNDVNGSGNPQIFGGAGVAKPVATLYNGSGGALTVWYNITTFTNGIVASENFLINNKGAACPDTSCITGSVVFDTDTTTGVTIAAGAGNEKDLYLKATMGALAAKSGSSTITILGET